MTRRPMHGLGLGKDPHVGQPKTRAGELDRWLMPPDHLRTRGN